MSTQPLKLYPNYENPNPITLDELVPFLTDDLPVLYKEYRAIRHEYPLQGLSIDMTAPYNDYVVNVCIDLDPPPTGDSFYLSVLIPNTDRFLPIKSDLGSVIKAIEAIKNKSIPMYNETSNIDPDIFDYVR